jgi:type II/III secretion system protein
MSLSLVRLLAVSAALALAPAPAALAQPKETPRAPEPDLPLEKGLKSRIFEVKYRDLGALRNAVRALGSGARGAVVEANSELRVLTVRDFPENIASIEEAVKRLDRPEAAQRDVELRIHVLSATRSPAPDADLPADLKDTVAALRGTLNYKGYRLLTTFTQRVKDGTRGIHGGGVVTLLETGDAKQENAQTEFGIAQITVAEGQPSTVRLDGFKFALAQNGRAELATDVSVREGEEVVVGTSVYRDRGIVLVVSARLAR